MIAIDTNVLFRLLDDEDDPAQTARARAAVDDVVARGQRLFVADVVLAEVVWLLKRRGHARAAQIRALRGVLDIGVFQVAAPDVVRAALDAWESNRGGFADYLVREQATAAGCDAVLTFDAALLKEPGFVAP